MTLSREEGWAGFKNNPTFEEVFVILFLQAKGPVLKYLGIFIGSGNWFHGQTAVDYKNDLVFARGGKKTTTPKAQE